jgi:hypothetical protein
VIGNCALTKVVDFVADGKLKVKSRRHGRVLTLPGECVASRVELGCVATIDRVQSMTEDTLHILVNPQSTSREKFYVAATRGRESNHLYAVVEGHSRSLRSTGSTSHAWPSSTPAHTRPHASS